MKEFIIALCFFGVVVKASAFNEKLPIKYGKVTRAEFEVNNFQGDTAVSAIVLCDYGEISITNRTFYKRHIRIKINSVEGLKYAKFEIPYQYKEKYDDIIAFSGNVFELKNNEIFKYQYGNRNVRDIEVDRKNRNEILELPDVKPGMIVEFYYEIASLDFIKLDDWYFQKEIPVLWSEIRFDIPYPFVYLVTFQNGQQLSNDEQLKYAEKLQWLYNANRFKRKDEFVKSNNVLYESPSGKYRVYIINNMKKKIIMKNLPGVSSVSQFLSVKDYYPKLRFDLFESSGRLPWLYKPLLLTTVDDYEGKSRRQLMRTTEINGYVHYRLNTWMDFNEKLLKSNRFGMQLIKHFDYKTVTDSLITSEMNDNEKMKVIFIYIQKHFHWNGIYSMYVDNGLQIPFDKQTGTSGDINMLLIYLLRRTGLHADPVLIRTNDLGMPETVFPVHGQFNHVIAMVNINSETYLLDATSQEISISQLPLPDLFTTGWRVNNKDFGWIDIGSQTKRE